MGNRQVSGLISFTVYTRGIAPRHWVCGVVEQTGGLVGERKLQILAPLGLAEDVLVTQLGMGQAVMENGSDGVRVRGVFDGVHSFAAILSTMQRLGDNGMHSQASIGNSWNAAFDGRDGKMHVLSIEFKVSAHMQTAGGAHHRVNVLRQVGCVAHCLNVVLCCVNCVRVWCSLVKCSCHSGQRCESVRSTNDGDACMDCACTLPTANWGGVEQMVEGVKRVVQ